MMRFHSVNLRRPSAVTCLARLVASAALVFLASGLQLPAAYAAEAAAAPDTMASDSASVYIQRLLDEINVHREHDGSPLLSYVSPDANRAVSQYLTDLTPRMLGANSCFHGTDGAVGVQPSWDYLAVNGVNAQARGEVLGCPGFDGYWTPAQIASRWWQSPPHRAELYLDRAADTLACGIYGPQRGGTAFQTIACVTLRSS